MKYKGFVYCGVKHLQDAGINTREPHYFKLIGFWFGAKNQRIGSYVLCDKAGEPIKGLTHLQFSRTRENEFYLESVD